MLFYTLYSYVDDHRITYAKDLEQQLENITKAKTISGKLISLAKL